LQPKHVSLPWFLLSVKIALKLICIGKATQH
jgi:hypothetical protein